MKRTCLFLTTVALIFAATNINAQTEKRTLPSIRTKNLVVAEDVIDNSVVREGNGTTNSVTIAPNRLNATFYEGENVHFTVTTRKDADGYLYVFCVDCNGNTNCLYPNIWHHRNGIETKISGGEQIKVPANENAGFKIKVAAPFGIDHCYAVISKEKIDPAKVAVASFTKSNTTPVDTVRFKALVAEIDEQPGSIAVTTIRTLPKNTETKPVACPPNNLRNSRSTLFHF